MKVDIIYLKTKHDVFYFYTTRAPTCKEALKRAREKFNSSEQEQKIYGKLVGEPLNANKLKAVKNK